MLDKEKLLSHIGKEEEKIVLTKILDKVEKVLKMHGTEKSDFLDPYQRSLVDSILKGIYGVDYKFAGGYAEAERQRIIIFPDYYLANDIEEEIGCLKVYGNFKFNKVSHKDYLGAILALGIKREKIGDILVIDDGCQFFLDKDMVEFIRLNLSQIHKVTVKVEEISLQDAVVPDEKYKQINTTVSSLRLDVVSAAAFGLSRSQVSKAIASEKLKVNWGPPTTNPSNLVNAGDTLSLRGKGRIQLMEIKGTTAKGRFKISIKKLL